MLFSTGERFAVLWLLRNLTIISCLLTDVQPCLETEVESQAERYQTFCTGRQVP